MHMAVTQSVAEKRNIEDRNRLLLGAILPDFYEKEVSHLKIAVCRGQKRTYHLTEYRKRYGHLMASDALYLGYYLHLVQDIIYRDFVYNDHHWNPFVPGNVERLHRDYCLINSYMIETCGLQNTVTLPDNFAEEPINRLCPFEIQHLHDDLASDFSSDTEGEIFFFTREMADLYLQKACDLCHKEIAALRMGKTCMDEYAWAWDRMPMSR